ncbi:MAG TPA: TRAFs-binding domain-containing protein [Chthoniobacterales bacterium]
MVMPFGTKETRAKASSAPVKINFDSLWEKALYPGLYDAGYQPVRADQELGALIIKEMLERLYFSDLVLADLTIPNGNVYYEIGIRHAARDRGCVLISADWAEPLFDLDQMRQIRYPLPEEDVSDATASSIRGILKQNVKKMAEGLGPMHQTLQGYPDKVDPSHASTVKDFLEQLSEFQAATRAVRHAPAENRKALALALRDRTDDPDTPMVPSVALELLYLLRDYADGADTLGYIDRLPDSLRMLPVVREQRCLVQSMAGDHLDAIGALEELVRATGDSAERQGLIGGRYRRLYQAADGVDKRRYLNQAIDHYARGMMLDLNNYFPSSNLPRLYRARGQSGDDDRARTAATIALAACERAKAQGSDDEWLRPTLLGMAFDAGDVNAASELRDQVLTESPARWKLKATLETIQISIAQTKDEAARNALQAIADDLNSLV